MLLKVKPIILQHFEPDKLLTNINLYNLFNKLKPIFFQDPNATELIQQMSSLNPNQINDDTRFSNEAKARFDS